MTDKFIKFGPTYALERHLRARTSVRAKTVNLTARRDLERWYAALQDACPMVGPAEMLLLVEAVEGTPEEGLPSLVATLPEALAASIAPGYGHVRPELVEKARVWDAMERWAVVDACERYLLQEKEGGTTAEILHRIGMNPYGQQA